MTLATVGLEGTVSSCDASNWWSRATHRAECPCQRVRSTREAMRVIDVFVRMAAAPGAAGVVAQSTRWAPGKDPGASRHQVVTLFGDPTVTHLAWALAAANRGQAEAVWYITADGNATADEASLAMAVLREDAAALMSTNGAQLRTAIAHLLSIRGQDEHSSAIRVPLLLNGAIEPDAEAMLTRLREAEGAASADDQQEDDIAA